MSIYEDFRQLENEFEAAEREHARAYHACASDPSAANQAWRDQALAHLLKVTRRWDLHPYLRYVNRLG